MKTRTYELTVLSFVAGIFLLLLVCVGFVGSTIYAGNKVDVDKRYDVQQQEYTRLISQTNRENEIRYNRLQEQINSIQFTSSRRIELLEDEIRLLKKNNNKR
ncbi:hypothetical protein [Pseudomonas helleri]|uniref:hypothetical protein n=1 Tax=Pseudomonas helleri TaxID=1608996 RepID=UPI00242B5522|nr:hypothetical protein [Pseudomonas helleri]